MPHRQASNALLQPPIPLRKHPHFVDQRETPIDNGPGAVERVLDPDAPYEAQILAWDEIDARLDHVRRQVIMIEVLPHRG